MDKENVASIEPMPNYPSHYEIRFRIDGHLIGRGLITFNSEERGKQYLSDFPFFKEVK